jgi:histone deacetylase complex subunit SAP18
MTEINREKVCPFLLRVFYKEGDFNSLDEMNAGKLPTTRELHIYTWMDASLKELTTLIKEVVESARKGNAILNFSIIYPDSKGRLQRKEVGVVSKKNLEDSKTLQQVKFAIGDYIDINIGLEK